MWPLDDAASDFHQNNGELRWLLARPSPHRENAGMIVRASAQGSAAPRQIDCPAAAALRPLLTVRPCRSHPLSTENRIISRGAPNEHLGDGLDALCRQPQGVEQANRDNALQPTQTLAAPGAVVLFFVWHGRETQFGSALRAAR